MQLTVIGPGCARCKTLAQFTEQAAKELGLQYELIKVTDLKQIMALGVMMTPALAINGTVKVAGKVPSVAELKALLSEAAGAEKSGSKT
ncbi:thioredoxin family protein [Limisphaera sp. 4302-co]|uniref:thioredoxin family protein n=1 Tax=Limisphaera sp. 4302-co TaxID=3400417 RepID=UPI003C1CB3FB